ncbi:amidohydrolase [Saccharothrix carnea]|uniref:Amidohydrolase n=1 Tax=Saccharothrix carnea TaxID=1280637 RepID=A0A2P8HIF5_SACCR|nr:amidohydrolase [Saccharothrix carnea]PSL45999.1 amidohydrolase [Saccharothrix carnea]
MNPGSDRPSLDRLVADVEPDLIALRRDVHRWPELAGAERRTAALVAARLRAAGLAVSTGVGGHGVVAVLDGARPGPTVAYRADLDAVAADERAAVEFASRVPGAAHLCGHDVHTAVGVGVALVLTRSRERIGGRVVFVFQPAEETLAGARAMLDAGVLDPVAPDEVYALHCAPLPVGTFAVMPGNGLPGLDAGHVDLTGPDAREAGERFRAAIEGLSTVHRPATPEEFARMLDDVRTPGGPLARFVTAAAQAVPGDGGAVRVRFWLRAWPDDRYDALREGVRRLADRVGGRVAFPAPPFPAMVCSPELSHAAAAHLRGLDAVRGVDVFHAAFPFNGEDFALFLHRVPGAMLYLGVADPAAGINGVPHAPDFAADDRAIGIGVRAMADLLLHRLDTLGGRPTRRSA